MIRWVILPSALPIVSIQFNQLSLSSLCSRYFFPYQPIHLCITELIKRLMVSGVTVAVVEVISMRKGENERLLLILLVLCY